MTRLKKIKDLPRSARPDQRTKTGLNTIRTDELLAFILGSGVQGKDVKSITAEVLKKFGGRLLHASADELSAVKGIGPTKAARLVAGFELARRLGEGLPVQSVDSPSDVAKICSDLAAARQEYLGYLALDARGCLLARNDLYKGSRSLIVADPKHLLGEAVRQQAHAIILYHNHPAGTAVPSSADVEFANRMSSAGEILNIRIIDFVVISNGGWTSLLGDRLQADNPAYVRQGMEQMTLSTLLVEQPHFWAASGSEELVESQKESPFWAVDLFAGCGGLSLGLELAGFETLLVSELNKDAMDTFITNKRNKRHVMASFYDVYSITGEVLENLRRGWAKLGIEEIDLIAGGPPCQGYSGIGHRRSYQVEKSEIPSNYLFKEMTRIISLLRPKMFLFENVKGLLSARWTADGTKGEIWEAVQAEFKAINKSSNYPDGEYFVDFKLVQAKDYDVPQNRPRVLMVGIRRDLGWKPVAGQPASGLLPVPTGNPPNVEDVLSDLVDPDYLEKRVTANYLCPPRTKIQRWLRTRPDGRVAGKGERLTDQEYSNHAPAIREKFQHMLDNDGEIPESMRTKKFAQRVLPGVWDARGPTITVTSLPEDYVHYCQPRSLTVREWARLQMFPDWYEFRGPRTTGGIRRAGNPHKGIWDREVPKYTQIGNAVPVGLAHRVGEHLANILRNLRK